MSLRQLLLFCLWLCATPAAAAEAQTYPTRPVRLVVPFAPGGGNDFLGRLVGLRLGESMGQTFVIDNRAGAGGNIATDLVANAAAAVVSGEAKLLFSSITAALPHVGSRRVVALAVTSPNRSPLLPDVPTLVESGVRGLDVGSWYAIVAPAATPRAVISRLHDEIVKLTAATDYRSQLEKQALEPLTSSPDAFPSFIRAELEKWGRIIKASGIKPGQ